MEVRLLLLEITPRSESTTPVAINHHSEQTLDTMVPERSLLQCCYLPIKWAQAKAPAGAMMWTSQIAGIQGFHQQTKNWPEQPLEVAIRWLKGQPKKAKVADFGCGDAGLAKRVVQQVASLDLVAASPDVTACDMSSTPLGAPSIRRFFRHKCRPCQPGVAGLCGHGYVWRLSLISLGRNDL